MIAKCAGDKEVNLCLLASDATHFLRLADDFIREIEERRRGKHKNNEAVKHAACDHADLPKSRPGSSSCLQTPERPLSQVQPHVLKSSKLQARSLPVAHHPSLKPSHPTEKRPILPRQEAPQFPSDSAAPRNPVNRSQDEQKGVASVRGGLFQAWDLCRAPGKSSPGTGKRSQPLLDSLNKSYFRVVQDSFYAAKYFAASFPSVLQGEASKLANAMQNCLLKLTVKETGEACIEKTTADLIQLEDHIQKWLRSDVGQCSLRITSANKESLWDRLQEMKKQLDYPVEQVCWTAYHSLKKVKQAGNSKRNTEYLISMCEMSIRLFRASSAKDLSPRLTQEGLKKIGTYLNKIGRGWYNALVAKGKLPPVHQTRQ